MMSGEERGERALRGQISKEYLVLLQDQGYKDYRRKMITRRGAPGEALSSDKEKSLRKCVILLMINQELQRQSGRGSEVRKGKRWR